jgi:hypothetical protein
MTSVLTTANGNAPAPVAQDGVGLVFLRCGENTCIK